MAGLTAVIVRWADAHAGTEHWTPLEELDDDGEYIVSSVGWLLPVDEGGKADHVTVVQSVTVDDHVDHVLHIPVSMVRTLVSITSPEYVVSPIAATP